MEPACRKDKSKLNSTPTRGDRAKQKSAQQELKQRQRAEVTNMAVFNPGTGGSYYPGPWQTLFLKILSLLQCSSIPVLKGHCPANRSPC